MCGLYCIAIIEYMPAGKSYFLEMIIKQMTRQYVSIFQKRLAKFNFRLKKLDETRKDLLEDIKQNE